jgi:hypothetical protein
MRDLDTILNSLVNSDLNPSLQFSPHVNRHGTPYRHPRTPLIVGLDHAVADKLMAEILDL